MGHCIASLLSQLQPCSMSLHQHGKECTQLKWYSKCPAGVTDGEATYMLLLAVTAVGDLFHYSDCLTLLYSGGS